MCGRVKLYCPDVFIRTTTAETGPFYTVRNLTWCPHTCVQPLPTSSTTPSAHFSARLCIFSFDSFVIPRLFYWRLITETDDFPAHAGTVVRHGNRWVTLTPAATTTSKLTTELCRLTPFTQGYVIIRLASHFISGIMLFTRSATLIR